MSKEADENDWLEKNILALTSQDSQSVVVATADEGTADKGSTTANNSNDTANAVSSTQAVPSAWQEVKCFDVPNAASTTAIAVMSPRSIPPQAPPPSYKDQWIPGRIATAIATTRPCNRNNQNTQSTTTQPEPRDVATLTPPDATDDKHVVSPTEHEDSFMAQHFTPTVHAVPVHEDQPTLVDDDETDEAAIQRLLQQDALEEQLVAVVAVPADAEQEEIQLLRDAVRSLHSQLQNQDAQVRQLRQQLESLSSSTSSSNTAPTACSNGNNGSDIDRNHPTPSTGTTFWKRYRCLIWGVGFFIVVIIIIVAAMTIVAGGSNHDGMPPIAIDPQPPTLVPTFYPTLYPSAITDGPYPPPQIPDSNNPATTAPTEAFPNNTATAAPTTEALQNDTATPTVAPTGGGEPPGGHGPSIPTNPPTVPQDGSPPLPSDDSNDSNSLAVMVSVVAVCLVLAAAAVFWHRHGRKRLAACATTTTKPVAKDGQEQERLKAEVMQALHEVLSSRAETARRLQAILKQKSS